MDGVLTPLQCLEPVLTGRRNLDFKRSTPKLLIIPVASRRWAITRTVVPIALHQLYVASLG